MFGMKILYSLFLLLVLVSCKNDDVNGDQVARKVAWNSLEASVQSTVITPWQEATVTSETYQGRNVYAVRFNTVDDPLLGPIVVYVSKVSMHVVGYAPRF